MYLPLRTAKHNKGNAARRTGIWLGTIEGIEETLVGATAGAINCRTCSRLAEGEMWNCTLATEMQGVLPETGPGSSGQHIPVEIGADGQAMDEVEEGLFRKTEDAAEDEQDADYIIETHNLHISLKAINKHGTTHATPSTDGGTCQGVWATTIPRSAGRESEQRCRMTRSTYNSCTSMSYTMKQATSRSLQKSKSTRDGATCRKLYSL